MQTGLVTLVIVTIAAVGGEWIAPHDPNEMKLAQRFEGSSWEHPLGLDQYGRDVASRIIAGARFSLGIGLGAALFGLLIGFVLGGTAGFFGGRIDSLIMRFNDVLQAFPGILLGIAVVSALGPGLVQTIVAVAIAGAPNFTRIVRASVMTVKARDYVTSAVALGAKSIRVFGQHIVPNGLTPVLVVFTFQVGSAILVAAGLSFLGIGVQPPAPEWGVMIADGRNYLRSAPHLSMWAGVAMSITVIGINLVGDGIRDALDPKQHAT